MSELDQEESSGRDKVSNMIEVSVESMYKSLLNRRLAPSSMNANHLPLNRLFDPNWSKQKCPVCPLHLKVIIGSAVITN